ncbi:amino acid ABC transporter permease [Zavarzinia sp. CC-PAN008]|uniref:amino acid ABC transporter permease n=1 Tax=Zavarzinia sp. CC-PAN008 TaxID=3243332 RepID=UPI003F74A35A
MTDQTAGRAPAIPFWRDPTIRSLIIQAVLLVVVLGTGWILFKTATDNMAKQGIASGFAFLDRHAGFDISMSMIDYPQNASYGRALLVGLVNTLLVSAIGIVVATVIGFLVGIARLSSNWLVAQMATVYVETLRNTPLLLQILFWYFAVLRSLPGIRQSVELLPGVLINNRGLYVPRIEQLPGFDAIWIAGLVALVAAFAIGRWARARQLRTGQPFPSFWVGLGLVVGLPLLAGLAMGVPLNLSPPEIPGPGQGFNIVGGFVLLPELVALVVALSLYTASFIAEVVRGGILSVSRGQTEAAQALGLTRGQTMRLVVVPQAMRVVVPPLTSQYLNLVKNSSLATAIAYPDLVQVFAGTVLNQTGQAVEVIAVTMAIYLSLSLIISAAMNWYNARIKLVER